MEGGSVSTLLLMDYNDHDYEGQNLHLAGEESSKISVLRPFALPKFDFDDSLHGNLRFDSLVENEVFLGIPSQEDNHWIEDFSRGGDRIEFSSSAAESCALPRHINVWSEATSSESVEMLLKAVGQEEMVPGENMIEESDPANQLGRSTVVENNLRNVHRVNDVDNGIPSLLPDEVDGSSFSMKQTLGYEKSDHTLQVQEANFSSYGVGIDNEDSALTKTTENLSFGVKRADISQGEIYASVDESLSHQMQEDLSVLGKEIDNTESSSRNIGVSSREAVDQDKISSIDFSSSCTVECTSNPVEQQDKGRNETDSRLSGISVETDKLDKPCSQETTSSMQSPKEEQAVDTCTATKAQASSVHGTGASVSKDNGCSEVAFFVEPADCSQHSSVSGPEIKQLPDNDIMLHGRSSIVLQGEGIEGLEMGGSYAIPIVDGNNVMKQGLANQSPDTHKTLVGSEAVSAEGNSSLQAPCATSEPTMLHELLGNPSEKDHGHKTDDAEGHSGKFTLSAVSGACCEKSASNARNTVAPEKAYVKDGDHVHSALVGVSTWTCKEDDVGMQVDAHESDVNVSAHEKESEKFPLDSNEMAFDADEKEVRSTRSVGGVELQKTTGSKPGSSDGNHPALNTEFEGTNLSASCIDSEQSVDSREHNLPSAGMKHNDQHKETESEASTQPSPSVPGESKNELSPAGGSEKDAIPDSIAGEGNTSHQSVSLLETSSVNIPDEASKESKTILQPTSASLGQNDAVESLPSKEPMVSETEIISRANSSKFSVTLEIDKPNKEAVPVAGYTGLSQSEVNQQAPLKRNGTENFQILKTSEASALKNSCKEDETFTFDTRTLGGQSTIYADKGLLSFPGLQACKIQTGEGFPATFVSCQTGSVIVKEISHVGSSTPGACSPSGGVGPLSERKSRRGSNKSGKGSLKKGSTVKESSPLKQTEKGDGSSTFLSPLGTGQLMTFESGVKSGGAVSIPTSSLPDLNTSAPSSSFFKQPFTDLQQVQLRAQIFVYGSLIQGAAPDEACMVSAFGMSDGGRSAWERSWRACVEKVHGQKSHGNNIGTPIPPSRSGAKAQDQTNRQGFPQSEVLSSTAGRPINKAIASPVNPVISLPSPLWNISNPSGESLPPGTMARGAVIDYQAVSPLNPYQTPPMRNYIAHSTWLAQVPPAPFAVPWFTSSQSSPFEVSTTHPALPISESLKLTAVKESPLPITSATKHASHINSSSTGATAMLSGISSIDMKIAKGPTDDTKTKKRKKSSGFDDVVHVATTVPLSDAVSAHAVSNQLSNKAPASEDFSRISLTQNQVGLVPAHVGGSYYSACVAVTAPSSFVPIGPSNQAFPVVSPSISSSHLSKGDLNADRRAFNTEGFSKVEEAKFQAQEAAANAAAAISQCEGVWSLLDLHKSSRLASDAESKLASAAAAIAAAASVAKAAAAAAKIASDAAVQAKQMADEALSKSGTSNTTENDSNFVFNSMNLVNAPTSILKGGDRSNASTFVVSAAREAARKRIEAASAATRHAENLDAILKAAELAAEAVAHAGKVVAMGDPFSLSSLAEAGPSNYWKVTQVASLPGSKSKGMNTIKSTIKNAAEAPSVYNQHEGSDKDAIMSLIQTELSKDVSDHLTREEDHISSVKHVVNSSKSRYGGKVSDSDKTMLVVSDQDMESRASKSTTSWREGSLVEVLKDRDDSKRAWFSASVLSLKDGEALVCYIGLQSDKGSEQLKEWISLEAKDGETPVIRVPHPMTGIQFEGTKKRRHAAVKDHTWSVGDRVDVWMQDCWREGIVAEKNKKDSTSLSVHFPAQGEILQVKMWHLRPSVIWSDGEWIEWCRPEQDGTHEGDTPNQKRPKLGSTSIEAKGKAKMAENIDSEEVGANKEPKLPLSANEKVFSIGSTREENKPSVLRSMRSVLEKGGSRVVIGVPKPGKKRKFMEVSKHFVSERSSKTNVPNDSVKLSKFFMPQGSGPRGFRNSSKLYSKEKNVAHSKPRALKSGKPPSVPSRTLARTDGSTSSQSNARDDALSDNITKNSINNEENESSDQNLAEADEATGGAFSFSSQALPQGNRKKAVRNIKSERLNQGKLPSAGRKSAKDEATEKIISEVGEPRRSNRRIQPTSRLLEGLQSSLIVSKIPSSSHDKGHKSHNTGKGNNNRG